MQKTYKIDGMTCGGCVGSVTRALESALPDNTIEVSLDNATVQITGEHNAAAAKEAIEDAGFDFGGAATPPR